LLASKLDGQANRNWDATIVAKSELGSTHFGAFAELIQPWYENRRNLVAPPMVFLYEPANRLVRAIAS